MLTLRIRSLMWFAAGLAIAIVLVWSLTAWRASAISPNESTFVPVTPVRILDSRDPTNVGLPGPFVSAVSQDLQVTGNVPTTIGNQVVVPAGATGVVLNVTAVSPTANGFLSIRPADAPGTPTTSSLNVISGDILPNAVTVNLPTAGADVGKIEITFDAYGTPGPTVDVLIDVVGYNTNVGLQELETRLAALEAGLPIETVINYSGSNTEASPASDFELLRTIGNFTKVRADSVIRMELTSHHESPGLAAGVDFCHYQLRIDGFATNGSPVLEPGTGRGANAVAYISNAPVSATGYWNNLAAGVHAAQIYVRGTAATCTLNDGNFSSQFLIEELDTSSLSALSALEAEVAADEGLGGG
jgi:hypothetical protein